MKEQTSKNLSVDKQINISTLKNSILAVHLWNYITTQKKRKGA